MGKSKTKEGKQNALEKLIQQVQRFQATKTTVQRPPDAAAAALGKAIGHEFLQQKAEAEEELFLVLRTLCQKGLHPSIPHAFFDVLIEAIIENNNSNNSSHDRLIIVGYDNDDEWLSHWVLQLEQVVRECDDGRAKESLVACIRTYVTSLLAYHRRPHPRTKDDDDDEDQGTIIMNTYNRLQLLSSRIIFIKELITVALRKGRSVDCIRSILSPVLAVTVLSAKSSSFEQSLCMRHLWRGIWVIVWESQAMNQEDCLELLSWLTQALDLFLTGPKQGPAEEISRIELAESWLTKLLQLAQALAEDCADGKCSGELSSWLGHILGNTLPILFSTEQYLSWKPLLSALLHLTSSLDASRVSTSPLEPTTAFRLCGILLQASAVNDRQLLLQLFATDFIAQKVSISCQTVTCLFRTIGAIYIQDADVRQSALLFQESLEANTNRTTIATGRTSSMNETYLDSVFVDAHTSSFISTILETTDFSRMELSVQQQITALLFALSQFTDNEKRQKDCYTFLKRLLNHHTHLGITLIPVVLYLINSASVQKDGKALIQHMEFLSEALVKDSHAAQEVWKLIGNQWLSAHRPLSVRTMVIRLFPRLCKSNKRLYRRAIEELGVCVVDKQPEIRLSVAATIADLAKEDCIRDVSDVIAWIQQLLMEELEDPIHSLIVYYAVLSLHYLVTSGELDFDLVVKVLNKRLCPVSDATKLLELPFVVLESLALLLGDGEVAESENSESDDGDDQNGAVSAQVTASVSALISISRGIHQSISDSRDVKANSSLQNIQRNIFQSLCNYSNDALCLHDQDMQTSMRGTGTSEEAMERNSASRYHEICELVALGLEITKFDVNTIDPSDEPIVVFARRIVSMEEDFFGIKALWKKGGFSRERSRGTREANQKSLAVLSALPPASQLESLSPKTPSHALSIAMLLSADGSHLTSLRDHADSAIETSDPLILAFAVKGFLHATLSYQSLSKASVKSTISEIRGWYEVFVSPDAFFLILSSFGVIVAETEDGLFATSKEGILKDIHDEVMGAFKSGLFQKEEIPKICLGLVGYACLLSGGADRVWEVVDLLEKSIRGYGGQQGFGAYFAMSFLSQAALKVHLKKDLCMGTVEKKKVVTKVCSFIIEELLSCFEDAGDVCTTLVACIKTGKSTNDLVRSLKGLGPNSVSLLTTKRVAAQYLLISCSLCLPTLVAVDGALLLSAFRLLESFEWISGKGIAIAAVLEKIANSSLLSSAEIARIHAEYYEVFEGRIGGSEESLDADGLDDIFYACNSMSKKAASVVHRRLLVGNKDLFDDDGCAVSLIACVSSISSLPPLGIALYTEEAMLHSGSTKEDVAGVVEVVSKAVARNDGSKYSALGVVLLGMLASIQAHSEMGDIPELPTPLNKQKTGESTPEKGVVSFSAIPLPLPGTLSAAIVSILEKSYSNEASFLEGNVVGVLGAMEALALPKEYAKQLLEKVLWHGDSSKLPAIRLLFSQLQSRRSIVHNGRDFVNLAVSFSTSSQGWNNLLSGPSEIDFFIRNFYEILPTFPLESLTEVLSSVWGVCLSSQQGEWDSAPLFLSSFKVLLANAGLSPKALSCVRDFALNQLYTDIVAVQLDRGMRKSAHSQSLVETYAYCLTEIPLSILDERDFFTIGGRCEDGSEELLRAVLSLMLCRFEYFPLRQNTQLITSITSWLNKNLAAADGTRKRDSLRRLFCCFATAANTEESKTKRDRLEKLFEILLFTTKDTGTVGLELLSVVVAYWSTALDPRAHGLLSHLFTQSADVIETLPIQQLDQFVQVAIDHLPSNLRNVLVQEKLETFASSHLHRLYMHWLECGVAQRPLEVLEKSLSSCRYNIIDQDIFENITGKLLKRRTMTT